MAKKEHGCELFKTTNGWGCFRCERPDCTYSGTSKDDISREVLKDCSHKSYLHGYALWDGWK